MARHIPEICNTLAFPRQEWLRERASVLRYTYIVCFVSLVIDLLCCSRQSGGVNQPRHGAVSRYC
jgi:hypothetical protein